MTRTGKLRRFRRLGTRIFKWLTALVLLATGGAWFWANNDYSQAAESLEFQMERARELGIPLEAKEVRRGAPVLEAENAAFQYREAHRIFKEVETPKAATYELERWARGRSAAHLGEVAAYLRPLGKPLEIAIEASRRPHCDFKRDWNLGPDLQLPEYAECKGLARVLLMRSTLRAREANFEGSLIDLEAVVRIAQHSGEDPVLIGMLVNVAIDSMAMRGFEYLATFAADDIRILKRIQRSLRELPQKPSIKEAFRGEGFHLYTTARNLDRFTVAQDVSLPVPMIFPLLMDKEMVCKAYAARTLEYWNGVFETCEQSDWNLMSVGRYTDEVLNSYDMRHTLRPSDQLGAVLYRIYSQCGTSLINMEARRRVTQALIEVLIYRAKHRQLPTSLEEAGVHFADPFDIGPLKYTCEGKSFRVYSVGRDFKDDGAKPSYEKEPTYTRDTAAFFPAWDGYLTEKPAGSTGN